MGAIEAEILTADAKATVVAVRGELDIATADELEALVAPIIAKKPTRLVLDLSELQFADSSAIAQWVRWSAGVEELELRNPPPLIRRVIASMGLEKTLCVTP